MPPFRLESRFYIVGPAIQIALPHRLSVEFDALYHRQGFFYTFLDSVYYYHTYGERDDTWEFPLLLRYSLRGHAINPFIEAGIAPRTMRGQIAEISQNDFSSLGPPASSTYPASNSPDVGFVSGGGIQFKAGHLSLAPQLRYTRWFTTPVRGADYSRIGGTFSSNPNQLDILVGIGWKLR